MNFFEKGLTLIEILVVVTLIGVLSSILIVTINPNEVILNSKIRIAERDIQNLSRAMYLAKTTNHHTLQQITGSYCSECPCRPNTPENQDCIDNWQNVLDTVSALDTYVLTNIRVFKTDPWGHPYMLDENEGEYPADKCRIDTIYSLGADGTTGGDDNVETSYSDIPFILPECL